ncbi:DUF952 domain-containing protein [Streptomyces antnestii]|uniref:DUF952 domain-containing protein n=1 Tax=Streptomyces antnestii TaxID=2494256 RepID=A0A3S2V757_9ACTN|nr:DUF952 domain-containing protein [Streptomyces sp. San01]RVU17259.1 DUF952 domain-containing protein [Streptomyces sp. San01]
MTELLHITERALWDAACRSGAYEVSTRGRTLAEEGFIHCSLAHQLQPVADFLYGDYDGPDELVVLVIDSTRVPAPVRFEAAKPGGEEFPHIYGPLPVDAVTVVLGWGADR